MQLHIACKHLELQNDTRQYLNEKMQKLDKYLDQSQLVEVVLKKENERNYQCEFLIQLHHSSTIVIDVNGEDLNSAIDSAIDKCERQLRRIKEKKEHSRRRSARLDARPPVEESEDPTSKKK